MQQIGNPERFAIQYELDENFGGIWIYGKFCYWCGGLMIGNYAEGISLRDVLFALDSIQMRTMRHNEDLFKGDPTWAFELINKNLFWNNNDFDDEASIEASWDEFLILPDLDIFNDWKAFLINGDFSSEILFSQHPYIEVKKLILNKGEVDSVIDSFREKINSIYEAELKIAQQQLHG